jgi:nucleoside-diphosphate-sugar epimerase
LMKIFVTGGTGFIGSHFLNRLSAERHEVFALKRPGSAPRIPLKAQPQWLPKIMPELTVEDLRGCEMLVHIAAHSANVPYDTFSECLRWNVLEPCILFEKAMAAGVRRFVVAGSCFEYGRSGEQFEFIPPDAPLEPAQSYPTSKAAASIALAGLAREKKAELLILRIFQVFGEGELESRFWPSLRRAALAGEDFPMTAGEQVRDFVPVATVVEKFVAALARTDLRAGKPKIENVGTGRPQTLRTFAEFWWQHWNAKGNLKIGATPHRVGEVMRYVPKITQ